MISVAERHVEDTSALPGVALGGPRIALSAVGGEPYPPTRQWPDWAPGDTRSCIFAGDQHGRLRYSREGQGVEAAEATLSSRTQCYWLGLARLMAAETATARNIAPAAIRNATIDLLPSADEVDADVAGECSELFHTMQTASSERCT